MLMTSNVKDFKIKVVKQLYSPVRWTESVENLINNGVDTFIEFGEGHVLTGLVKRINQEVNVYNVPDYDSLKSTIESLGEK